jgi:hypothetical protein
MFCFEFSIFSFEARNMIRYLDDEYEGEVDKPIAIIFRRSGFTGEDHRKTVGES